MTRLKIVIGSDHAGFNLKRHLIESIKKQGHTIEDYGTYDLTPCDYPATAFKLAKAVSKGLFDRGVLVCGTGLGMAMAANKVSGARAVTCTDPYSAKMSILHNDANILCFGERVTGIGLADEIITTWLLTNFEGGRHQNRVEMINKYKD